MARPTAVKKKPKKVISEEKLRELAKQSMEDFTAEAKARYDKAKLLYNKQNDDTQDALDRMITLLVRIARKNMWVGAGPRGDRIVMAIPEETIYHNMFYMAVEIIKDLALMDVKVADFTFAPDLCAECYGELTPIKKKVKK